MKDDKPKERMYIKPPKTKMPPFNFAKTGGDAEMDKANNSVVDGAVLAPQAWGKVFSKMRSPSAIVSNYKRCVQELNSLQDRINTGNEGILMPAIAEEVGAGDIVWFRGGSYGFKWFEVVIDLEGVILSRCGHRLVTARLFVIGDES